MIRLLHIADVHLGATFSAFGSLARGRRQALHEAFRSLVRAVSGRRVDALLIAGDLFDSASPSQEEVATASEGVRRFLEAGIPVLAVPGNHDPLTPAGSPYDELPAGVHVFREPCFGRPVTLDTEGGPLHVYGLAYDRHREPDPLASFERAEAPGAHVVLLHASLKRDSRWGGGHALRLPPGALEGLPIDYLALGDWHSHRTPQELAAPVPACYPGSLAALDLTETGPHGFVLAELDVASGGDVRVELHPSGLPMVVDLGEIDVSACEDEEAAATAVADALQASGESHAIPSATLTGQLDYPLDAGEVEARLVARFGAVRLMDRTWCFGSGRIAALAAENTIAGHVARLGVERAAAAGDERSRRLAEQALRLALRHLDVR